MKPKKSGNKNKTLNSSIAIIKKSVNYKKN